MKRDQVEKKKLEVVNKFKEEIEVETELKLNCVKTEVDMTETEVNVTESEVDVTETEVDVTETELPRPLNQTLLKSWFAQKIAEALRE